MLLFSMMQSDQNSNRLNVVFYRKCVCRRSPEAAPLVPLQRRPRVCKVQGDSNLLLSIIEKNAQTAFFGQFKDISTEKYRMIFIFKNILRSVPCNFGHPALISSFIKYKCL